MKAKKLTRPGTIAFLSIPWEEHSPLAFLRRAANEPRVFWESDRSPVAFAGFGCAARVEATGPKRFAVIKKGTGTLFGTAANLGEASPSWVHPRFIGGFSFEPSSEPDPVWDSFPDASFLLPRYLLTIFENQTWLTVSHQVDPTDDPEELEWRLRELIWDIPAQSSAPYTFFGNNGAAPDTYESKMRREEWEGLVSRATKEIKTSDMDKVVLARAIDITPKGPVNPAMVLGRLAGKFPNCYRFLYEPVPGKAIFGATPELLARVEGRALTTMGLAGSIRRGETLDEDLLLGEKLLNSPKEREEHSIVVEEIERNLTPLLKNIDVSQPTLLKLSNIQHIFTPIKGVLHEKSGILNVVEALHPTPAVGGIPRKRALDFIRTHEPTSRGWYAAPIGWIGPGENGEFAVALRSAVTNGKQIRIYAGAGIVADSEPPREWRETNLKFLPMMENLHTQAEQTFSHE